MKSIKPGRGPSKLSAIIGILVALFGVFWTIGTLAMGAWFMAPFGIIFIIMSVVNVVYNYKNATGEERYSAFDIVDSDEEGDPLNRRYGKNNDVFDTSRAYTQSDNSKGFCPYCGKRLESDFAYCPHCGKRIEK